MRKRAINVRLDGPLLEAVDALARSIGADRTEVISRGLRRELLHESGREFIYVLLDPTWVVRYVGRSRDPFARFREHLDSAVEPGSTKERWIAELLAEGAQPRMAIIDDAQAGEEVREVELFWIEHFRGEGKLTNAVVGGVSRVGGVRPVSFRWEEEFIARVDGARGEMPRSAFVRQCVEERMNGLDELAKGSVPAARAAKSAGRLRRSVPVVAAAVAKPCSSCRALVGHQRGCPKA